MNHTSLVLALSCFAFVSCGRGEPPQDEHARPEASKGEGAHEEESNSIEIDATMARDLRITTRVVESRPGGERATLLGELAVDQRKYAEIAAPAGARVVRVLVDAGDRVRQGELLAELASAELGRSRAEYLSASARVKLAEAALERKRGLAEEKIVPLRELQEAESALAEARATQRAARASIAAFGVEAADADDPPSGNFAVRSPVSGWVTERHAVQGGLTDPSTPAFKVGDLSTLWLTVHAFERDAVRIRRGAIAHLSFSALPGEVFEGRVTAVGRSVERESRTIAVRIDVSNRGGELRPGMSATAAVPVGDTGKPIVMVPVASVQRVRGEWCVFLPGDEHHFEIRRIGRGRDLGGSVEILSGLEAGEKVVVDGAFLLKAQAEKGSAGHDDH